MSEHIEAEWHIYASVDEALIDPDNGLSPHWRQAIIWTNARLLLIGPLGTTFNENWIKIQQFSFKKMHWKMCTILSRSQCANCHVTMFRIS